MEAIILAGGLGTRLRSVVPDLPKCMAPINGYPFISYLIDHLIKEGITYFIFALGYKSEAFISLIEEKLPMNNFTVVIEVEPLGTGGAIKLACKKAKDENVIALNGDSLFKVDLSALMNFHLRNKANCTLALKPMKNFDRYGSVEVDTSNKIKSFKEKKFIEYGNINGGVYVINIPSFIKMSLVSKFSMEQDYLEKYTKEGNFNGFIQDNYFIDIGIPEDYARAQIELL
jgi:D-glycero-alpha-D-manno-heptose 1-phosphate guanylyltransferase